MLFILWLHKLEIKMKQSNKTPTLVSQRVNIEPDPKQDDGDVITGRSNNNDEKSAYTKSKEKTFLQPRKDIR